MESVISIAEAYAWEVRKLTWEGAASKCLNVYERAIETMPV